MASPIFQLFLARSKSQSVALSKGEQDAVMVKVRKAQEECGAKPILLCESNWSNKQWSFFGIEEHAGMGSLQKHAKMLDGLNWPYRYLESFTILGTKSR